MDAPCSGISECGPRDGDVHRHAAYLDNLQFVVELQASPFPPAGGAVPCSEELFHAHGVSPSSYSLYGLTAGQAACQQQL